MISDTCTHQCRLPIKNLLSSVIKSTRHTKKIANRVGLGESQRVSSEYELSIWRDDVDDNGKFYLTMPNVSFDFILHNK